MVGGKTDSDKGNTGMKAHSAAVGRLKEAHPEEFEQYLVEERVSRGLNPRPGGPMTTEEKIAKLQAQIDKLRNSL